MKNPIIVIVDSGVGNIWSVLKAVQRFAPGAVVTEDPAVVTAADAIILPGVGSFKAGMDGLNVRGLIEPLQQAAKKGVPILGICLGAQLLLDRGYEFGEHEGLGIIKGEVVPFTGLPAGSKIPVIDWQEVVPHAKEARQLLGTSTTSYFYFVHSYVLKPDEESNSFATTSYNGYSYCAVVGKGNIFGTQFHPEKSGEAGLQLIKNFISII